MSKLSKLFAIGTGIAIANYYSKNPNKVEEHTEYVKKKSKDYYGYTRCMIRYTKKNGVEEAAIYLYNDLVKNLKKAKNALENILGKDNVEVMEDPVMGAEDFAYFGKHIPSFFFFVGVNDEQLENENMLHHPKLFWDEKYLITNMKTLSQLAVEFLNFNWER